MALVLVVDDEPGMLETLGDVLQEMGHEDLRGSDGHEALELARNRRPELIISDYMMPGRTGIELIRALRVDPALAHIPVILMSAARPRATDEAWRFLQKPLDLGQLERAINEGLTASAGAGAARPAAAPANVSPLTLAREEMLNWVAHEIKSPLSAAVMTTQLMRREVARGEVPKSLDRRLEIINRQLHQMDELVNSILDAARLGEARLTLELCRESLVDVVESCVNGWRELHPTIEFTVKVQEPAPAAIIDRQRYRQIVDNLLSNAVKYGVPPRRILVEVGRRGGEAYTRVRDFGRGIPRPSCPTCSIGSTGSRAWAVAGMAWASTSAGRSRGCTAAASTSPRPRAKAPRST
jgi:signal transduction histidine kinase